VKRNSMAACNLVWSATVEGITAFPSISIISENIGSSPAYPPGISFVRADKLLN